MKRIAIQPHRSNYPDPIYFDVGDRVIVGDRDSSEYPGWTWARTADGNAGWAPESMLSVIDGHTALATERYTSRELNTQVGDIFVVIRELNGWCWVRTSRGDEGWLPIETTVESPPTPAAERDDT